MSLLLPRLESVTDITPETIEAMRCYRELCTKIENVLSICPENTQLRLTELYKSLNIDNAIERHNNNINKITQFVKARDYIAEQMTIIPTDSNIMQELSDIRESIDLDNANDIYVLTVEQIKKYKQSIAIIKAEIAGQKLPFSDIETLIKYKLDISLANSINLFIEIKDFIHAANENNRYSKLLKLSGDAIKNANDEGILGDSRFILNFYFLMFQTKKDTIYHDAILEKINEIREEKNKQNEICFNVILFIIFLVAFFISCIVI